MSTGSNADIRITAWATSLAKVLSNSNVTLEELFAYIDDLRTIMNALIEGTKYCKECKTLYHSPEKEVLRLVPQHTSQKGLAVTRVCKEIAEYSW